MGVTRRQFMRVSAAGLAATSVGALGFVGAGPKLERATETRNTCPYCSVSCGVIVYTLGDNSKNARPSVIHIEGDPDHPVSRGTLCPRGSASLDYVHSPLRLKFPMHRKPGSDKFERVTWDFALDRIAALMKEDRDRNFVARNRDGVTVNRWLSTGFFATSAQTNEAGYLNYKLTRALGMVAIETQARI
jgi:formate dehydrogenase major subunit